MLTINGFEPTILYTVKLSVKSEGKKHLIVRHSRTQKLPPICLSEKLFEYVFQQSNLETVKDKIMESKLVELIQRSNAKEFQGDWYEAGPGNSQNK